MGRRWMEVVRPGRPPGWVREFADRRGVGRSGMWGVWIGRGWLAPGSPGLSCDQAGVEVEEVGKVGASEEEPGFCAPLHF